MAEEIEPGGRAPAFTLERDGGGAISLKDFKGHKLVVYFYPKADTPGCTREAIEFSRLRGQFAKAGTEIVGVSADPVERQDKIQAQAQDQNHTGVRPGPRHAHGLWRLG